MKLDRYILPAAFLLLLGGPVLTSCISPGSDPVPAETTGSGFKAETRHVIISQMNFSPSEITVNKGDKIVFENKDLVTHDITELDSKAWSSSALPPGQQWELTATTSVNYFCSLHPVMKGRVIVQ